MISPDTERKCRLAKKKAAAPVETARARKVLKQAQLSVKGFYQSLDAIRSARNATGNLTNQEQDLLRASVVFAAAGLDAVVKELIREAIRALAEHEPDVQKELETFVQRQLRGDSDEADATVGRKFLASILVSNSPQKRLIDEYILELTGSSLQSVSQLHKAAKALGLAAADVGIRNDELRPIFDARNKMIHELDVNLDKTAARRNQNSRTTDSMKNWSDKLLFVAEELVKGVEKKLSK